MKKDRLKEMEGREVNLCVKGQAGVGVEMGSWAPLFSSLLLLLTRQVLVLAFGGKHAKPSVYLHHSELAVNSTP